MSAGHYLPDVGGGRGLEAAGRDKSHHMVPDSNSPAINNCLPFGFSPRARLIPAQVAEKCKMLLVLIFSAVCAGRRRRGLEGAGAGPGHRPKPGAWRGGPETARTKAAPAPRSLRVAGPIGGRCCKSKTTDPRGEGIRPCPGLKAGGPAARRRGGA